jgi:hypothetical protein
MARCAMRETSLSRSLGYLDKEIFSLRFGKAWVS